MYTIGLDVPQRVSVLCILDSAGKLVKQERLRGDVNVLFAYLRKLRSPFQICYEASCGYGYLYDRLSSLARRVVVAHPGGVWLIFRAKRKHDRIDARKLATLLFLDQVPTVHVPPVDVRSWRRLIQFRRRLVAQRTAVKNRLRALLRAQGIAAPRRQGLWTGAGRTWLAQVEWPTREAALERDLGLEVAFTTAQRAIERLEKLGIVEQVGAARRDRVYCARAILDVLEEPARLTPA